MQAVRPLVDGQVTFGVRQDRQGPDKGGLGRVWVVVLELSPGICHKRPKAVPTLLDYTTTILDHVTTYTRNMLVLYV